MILACYNFNSYLNPEIDHSTRYPMKTQIDAYRKAWIKDQKHFRSVLESHTQHEEAIRLFMIQHGVMHSAKVAPEAPWSFEDLLFEDLSDDVLRRVPRNEEHSIAWLLWHLARCEDITMNMLAVGRPQVLDDWQTKLKIKAADTGNTMTPEEVIELSDTIDRQALRSYRVAVGLATRETVQQLTPEQLKVKVDPARLQQVLDQGAVLPAAIELVEYWGRRTIAGLLLMPPTRHNMVHINEAFKLKGKKE
jgi:hypothetical protein